MVLYHADRSAGISRSRSERNPSRGFAITWQARRPLTKRDVHSSAYTYSLSAYMYTRVGQSTSSTKYLKYRVLKNISRTKYLGYKYSKYFLVLEVFKYFFKYFKIINTKLCHYCLLVTRNFITYFIYFLFYFFIFILGVVLNFEGFLIKNNYCFWFLRDKNQFFYTFRKIYIS